MENINDKQEAVNMEEKRYTARFYNKYNWIQKIDITGLDLENVKKIKQSFAELGTLNQDNTNGVSSQINLREISFIEYIEEK